MAYGLTIKTTDDLCKRLGEKVNLPEQQIRSAMDEITREDVKRTALNEVN